MSVLVRSLCSGLLPKVGMEPSREGGIQAWILNGRFSPASPNFPNGLWLERVSAAEIAPYLNFDYERFALSCLESDNLIQTDRVKTNIISWPLLKSYYASFFAAHSIMRSRGAGNTQLNNETAKYLTDIVQTYNSSAPALLSGSYFFQISGDPSSPPDLRIEMRLAQTGQGVHDSFWRSFCVFLRKETEDAIKEGKPDSSNFFAESTELISAIQDGGTTRGVWLSSMRNDINYRHFHDAWQPVKKSSECTDALIKLPSLSTASLDGSKLKNPIRTFLNTTIFVSNLAINVGDFIAARSRSAGAFGQKWRRVREMFDP